jgi:hypothetical protein
MNRPTHSPKPEPRQLDELAQLLTTAARSDGSAYPSATAAAVRACRAHAMHPDTPPAERQTARSLIPIVRDELRRVSAEEGAGWE